MIGKLPEPNHVVPEPELLRRAAQGDKQAYGQLYERYLEPLYRYAYFRLSNEKEAEDLTAQVFLKAWEQITSGSGRPHIRNFRAWIYRIAHNLIVDRYRSRRDTVPVEETRQVSIPGDSLENTVQQNEEAQSLRQAINQLAPTYQQVIVCRFINQMSHSETAEVMGLRPGHVRVLQYRALKNLRSIMEKEHPNDR